MADKKFLFLFLFMMTASFHCFSQKVRVHVYIENLRAPASSDTIYYDRNRKLTWADFKGKPPANAHWGAMTASGFSFSSSMDNDGKNIDITIGIYSFFTKHDSWKRPDINSAYHLEHEQHHFDITRLGTQKLLTELQKAHFTESNYKELLNSIFDKVYDENIALQNKYDTETNNSINIEKQKEWNEKITAEINKLP